MAKNSYRLIQSDFIDGLAIKYVNGIVTWEACKAALQISGVEVRHVHHYKKDWDRKFIKETS